MNKPLRLAAAFLAVSSPLSLAVAANPLCLPSDALQLESLSELPQSIRVSLGEGRPGTMGIASRGQPFNKTDVVREELPMRRFVIAAASKKCILVAVERGGRGYSVEVLAFESAQAGAWQPTASVATDHVPHSVSELVELASRQSANEA